MTTDASADRAVRTPSAAVLERAATDPDTVAVTSPHRTVTVGELRDESVAIAAGLYELVGPGGYVFEQLPNSVDLLALRLACELAGVRLLSAPLTFRESELCYLFEEVSEPGLAFAPPDRDDVSIASVVAENTGLEDDRILTLEVGTDSLAAALPAADPAPHEAALSADDVCHLATTSGSSGNPDCVEMPIGARVRSGLVQTERFEVTRDDVVGLVNPMITGATDTLGYYGVAHVGSRLRILDRFDEATLADAIREEITVLPLVSTALTKLLNHVEAEGLDLDLSVVVNYGEKLNPSLGRRAERVFGCIVNQGYGAMDFGSITATATAQSQQTRFRTVGRPMDGNEVRLRTDDGTLTSETGVRGTVLADGPHRVGAFLTGSVDEDRGYYDTGDEGSFDANGNLVVHGRADDVVIRGGRNVYPQTIVEKLLRLDGVSHASVFGVPDETYGERVAAVITEREGASVSTERLLDYLREEEGVAPYKLPEYVKRVDDLPRVSAGHKVSVKKLRAMIDQDDRV